jgi:hypothetical protein
VPLQEQISRKGWPGWFKTLKQDCFYIEKGSMALRCFGFNANTSQCCKNLSACRGIASHGGKYHQCNTETIRKQKSFGRLVEVN